MLSSVSSPIVGIGELLWDLLPSGPRLGGAPTNFSTLSARLGDYVALVSRIGQDKLGRDAIASLETVAHAPQAKGHFDLAQIQVSSRLPTGTVTVAIDRDTRPPPHRPPPRHRHGPPRQQSWPPLHHRQPCR